MSWCQSYVGLQVLPFIDNFGIWGAFIASCLIQISIKDSLCNFFGLFIHMTALKMLSAGKVVSQNPLCLGDQATSSYYAE